MKNFLATSLSVVILGLLALSVLYAGAKLRPLIGTTHNWPIQLGLGILLVAAIAGTAVAIKSTDHLVGLLYLYSGYFFYFYLNLLLVLVTIQLAQFVWNVPAFWTAALATSIALLITVVGAIGANRFSVVATEIKIPRLTSPLTVVQLSDVHLGHHRGKAYLEDLVRETNGLKPDLVMITGDLVDSNVALLPGILEPLSQLSAPAYFVVGNHEEAIDLPKALESISGQGTHILHNQIVETHGIQIVGLDYMDADEDAFNMHPSHKTETIKSVMARLDIKPDMPSILLHHSPVGAQYVSATGIDLMLSGHTHGGQFFPFTLVNELIFPFNRGLGRYENTQVFVSQGAGTFTMKTRLHSKNELNVLHITP